MAHAPFSPGDKVESLGHLFEVTEGPVDGKYLLTPRGAELDPAPTWFPEDLVALADMQEWVPDGGMYVRRPRVWHLAARAAAPGQPLLCCGRAPDRLPGRDLVTRSPDKVTCQLRKPASRHYCVYKGNAMAELHHTEGAGTPTRKTCAGCRGQLIIEHGLWGVFRWTGDGRYPWEDAICTYTRTGLADERATSDEAKQDDPEHGGWVTRWIPLGS